MATTSRNIRFDDDLYQKMKDISKRPLTAAWHIQEASRQYLANNFAEKKDAEPAPRVTAKKAIKPLTDIQGEDLRLAEFIYKGVLRVAPKTKKPNIERWANAVRLMREQDSHTHREIAEVFDWANKDIFWQTNIKSPSKLREQFATLHAKMVTVYEINQRSNQPKQSLAERTADQARIINAECEAEEANKCFVDENDAIVSTQMGFIGRGDAE